MSADEAQVDVTGSAAVVWLALDGPRSRDELHAELAQSGCTDPVDELETALAVLDQHRLVDHCSAE